MALKDLTIAELDKLAEASNVDDYPSSGTKAEKVGALTTAGVADPAGEVTFVPEEKDTTISIAFGHVDELIEFGSEGYTSSDAGVISFLDQYEGVKRVKGD